MDYSVFFNQFYFLAEIHESKTFYLQIKCLAFVNYGFLQRYSTNLSPTPASGFYYP